MILTTKTFSDTPADKRVIVKEYEPTTTGGNI